MNLIEFNLKVNLPMYAQQELRLTRLDFLKIPGVGWMGRDRDTGEAVALWDMVPPSKALGLYRELTTDKSEYLDQLLVYSETSDTKYRQSYLTYCEATLAFETSVTNKYSCRVTYGGSVIPLAKTVQHSGDLGLLSACVGYADSKLATSCKRIALKPYKRTLLIPGWITPKHLGSLEAVSLDDFSQRKTVWTLGVSGWMGTLDGPLLESALDLRTTSGWVWSKLAEPWLSRPVELEATHTLAGLINLVKEASPATFQPTLLDILASQYTADAVRKHLGPLTLAQVKELETAYGVGLLRDWQEQVESRCVLGDVVFYRKHGQYLAATGKELQDITNFAIQIEQIDAKGCWHVLLEHAGKTHPLVLSEQVSSMRNADFVKYLRATAVKQKIGLLFVDPNFHKHLLELILKLNPNVTIS